MKTLVALLAAAIILFWLQFTVVVAPGETAVVFRFGHPHREVGPGRALRLPEPLEVVRRVMTGLERVTEVSLRPRNSEAPPGKATAHWLVTKATDFLLNRSNPDVSVKEAVAAASRDAAPDPAGAKGCNLLAKAQALLNEKRRDIRLLRVCTGSPCSYPRCGSG